MRSQVPKGRQNTGRGGAKRNPCTLSGASKPRRGDGIQAGVERSETLRKRHQHARPRSIAGVSPLPVFRRPFGTCTQLPTTGGFAPGYNLPSLRDFFNRTDHSFLNNTAQTISTAQPSLSQPQPTLSQRHSPHYLSRIAQGENIQGGKHTALKKGSPHIRCEPPFFILNDQPFTRTPGGCRPR